MQINSPLEQFEIFFLLKIFSFQISNYSLILLLSFIFISLFFITSQKRNMTGSFYLLPGLFNWIIESLYFFILTILLQQVGIKKGVKDYFPLVFSLFISLLIVNLIGLIPYSFTVTSHLMTTFSLSFIFFWGMTLIGFVKHGIKFLNIFIPKDVPKVLVPFLVCIELISFLSRMFSLAIRLFANMMSGHALLFILSSFVFKIKKAVFLLGYNLDLFSIIPLILVFLIVFLEVGIGFLQAYVFTVLITIYLNDSFNESAH